MGREIKLLPLGEGQPNPNKGLQAPQGTALPGRESVNFVQISALMNVANTFMAFLTNNRMADSEQPQGGPLDGGVKAAVEGTLIGLCNRVDRITDDESRWSLQQQDSLENSLLSLYAAQRENIRLQKESMTNFKAPHITFRPMLMQMEDGQWTAYYGNPENLNELIVGVGPNPEAAVKHYDEVFAGKNYEQQQEKTMDGSGDKVPDGEPDSVDGARTRETPKKKRGVRADKARAASKTGKGRRGGDTAARRRRRIPD